MPLSCDVGIWVDCRMPQSDRERDRVQVGGGDGGSSEGQKSVLKFLF